MHAELKLGYGITVGAQRRGDADGPSQPGGGRLFIRTRAQVELLIRHRWRTRFKLANAISEYLEIVHNRQLRHRPSDALPIEYERNHYDNLTEPLIQVSDSPDPVTISWLVGDTLLFTSKSVV